MFVAQICKYGIFVAKIYKYALIDSFQGSAGFLDSSTYYAALVEDASSERKIAPFSSQPVHSAHPKTGLFKKINQFK